MFTSSPAPLRTTWTRDPRPVQELASGRPGVSRRPQGAPPLRLRAANPTATPSGRGLRTERPAEACSARLRRPRPRRLRAVTTAGVFRAVSPAAAAALDLPQGDTAADDELSRQCQVREGLVVREPQGKEEREAAARLRAEAYYEDHCHSRFVETFKRHFVQQEAGSLLTRTQVGPNGFPECICLVAVETSPSGRENVIGTLDIRPPAGLVGSERLQKKDKYLNGVPVGQPSGSYVLNVCVAEESRGCGIGLALMEQACRLAHGLWSADRMYTEVDSWNEAAYGLYAKLGFERWCPEDLPETVHPAVRNRHMLFADLPRPTGPEE